MTIGNLLKQSHGTVSCEDSMTSHLSLSNVCITSGLLDCKQKCASRQKHIIGVVSTIASVYETREVEENVASGRAASGSRGH